MKPEITVMNEYTTIKKVMGVNGKGEPVEQCFFTDVKISEPIVAKVETRQYKNAVVIINGEYAVVKEGNWVEE